MVNKQTRKLPSSIELIQITILEFKITPNSTSSNPIIIHLILFFFLFFDLGYEKFSFQQLYI